MNVLMITGAGISVGSGIDTYRGADGRYTAMEKELGMPIHQFLSTKMLEEKPEVIWKYWLKFALSLAGKAPAPAHLAIKAISEQATDFLELTQNVDGLSLAAGLPPENLVELHGAARKHHCMNCGRQHSLRLEEGMALPPMCFLCDPEEGSTIRPSVLMFGEYLEVELYDKAMAFAAKADVVIISGTSMQFEYLWSFVGKAADDGAMIVYIDPEAEIDQDWIPVSSYSSRTKPLQDRVFCIKDTADNILPMIASNLEGCMGDLKALFDAS